MDPNAQFFRTLWPVLGPALTARVTRTGPEVRGLLSLLRLRPGARILDVPCGFGRHSVELARRGFRVTGVDVSAPLLARARNAAAAKGVRVEFCRADMRRLSYSRHFDVVLNLFTSFGYFGDAEDLRLLKRFHRALRPGGRLVLQLINRDWVMRNFRARDRARVSAFWLSERRTYDFATSVLTDTWTVRRGRRVLRGASHLRIYSCHELMGMLNEAGFRGVKCFGNLRGARPSLNSRWLVLLAAR